MQTEPSYRKLLAAAGFAWLFDAMDVGMLSFVVAALAKEWQLTSAQVGLIGSISSLGMAVGAVALGALADRFQRQNILISSLLIFSIFNGLSALAGSYIVFIGLRFIVGIGLGGELPVASTLVSEKAPATIRGRTVVLLESFWAGGWLLSALISYFLIPQFGWRVAVAMTSLTAVYAIVLRIHLKGTTSQVPQQRLSLTTRLRTIWSGTYFSATLMLWTVWFMVVFSYYGMFLWLPSVMVLRGYSIVESFGYVLLMTLAQLPGYFTAAWAIERWGRKLTLVVFLTGTAFSAILFGLAQSLVMLMIFGVLLSFFNLGAWGALYAYSPEQYPAEVRGTGTGLAAGFGRIGGIVGPLLVGLLLQAHVAITIIFGIFFAAILIAIAAILILGKETMAAQNPAA
ncbi:MFS transporter [Secundilactobacillus kimchicus]|uniref:MFS transporter n=1 Tax=Secundilactobacillus kimchicus TaxID=528209 RepID=UPI000704AAE3|nr:MFS transporter [Secundilactobacillus kimchicus]